MNQNLQRRICEKDVQPVTLYIPSSINFSELKKSIEPDFNFHDYHCAYLLHLLFYIPARNNSLEIKNGFVPIQRKALEDVIGHNYLKYVKWLEDLGVITVDKRYLPKVKVSGIKLNEEYFAELVPFPVYRKSYIKRFGQTFEKSKYLFVRSKSGDNQDLIEHLRYWNQLVDIDFKALKEQVNIQYEKELTDLDSNSAHMNRMTRLFPGTCIENKLPLFNLDHKVGRLHTSISQLKSDYRKFLSLNGEPLCQLDIANSQPYLATCLLDPEVFQLNNIGDIVSHYRNNTLPNKLRDKVQVHDHYSYKDSLTTLVEKAYQTDDVQEYLKHSVKGDLYELMSDKFRYDGPNARGEAKNTLFKALFSTNRLISISQPMQVFKYSFPTVYSVFAFIKKGKTKYHSLACTLQNLEARLVIHEIARVLMETKPECPIITIHDSICTTLKFEEYVREVMESTFQKFMHRIPLIKSEIFC